MGEVIVRLVVNKYDGTYEAKIVSHLGNSKCGDDIDEDIIEDLLNAEIPGYGNMATGTDSGHTPEYFEERQAKQSPHKYIINETEDDEEYAEDDRELGNGFGV